jgi:hypothetical protein
VSISSSTEDLADQFERPTAGDAVQVAAVAAVLGAMAVIKEATEEVTKEKKVIRVTEVTKVVIEAVIEAAGMGEEETPSTEEDHLTKAEVAEADHPAEDREAARAIEVRSGAQAEGLEGLELQLLEVLEVPGLEAQHLYPGSAHDVNSMTRLLLEIPRRIAALQPRLRTRWPTNTPSIKPGLLLRTSSLPRMCRKPSSAKPTSTRPRTRQELASTQLAA